MEYVSIHSPIGDITLFEDTDTIIALDGGWTRSKQGGLSPLLTEAIYQLNAYFTGALTDFDLPLAPPGTSFQRTVYREIKKIPHGETRTYADIAFRLNNSPRPIGNACGRNPIPIIIPCHRVRAASGLGGYSGPGGVDTKLHLLRLEGISLTDLLPL